MSSYMCIHARSTVSIENRDVLRYSSDNQDSPHMKLDIFEGSYFNRDKISANHISEYIQTTLAIQSLLTSIYPMPDSPSPSETSQQTRPSPSY